MYQMTHIFVSVWHNYLISLVITRFLHIFNLNSFALHLQGAERKTRDEERRAAKRKMTATGRKKLDELYHPVTDRSEFYTMQDLQKPPVLFSPADDMEKVSNMKFMKVI